MNKAMDTAWEHKEGTRGDSMGITYFTQTLKFRHMFAPSMLDRNFCRRKLLDTFYMLTVRASQHIKKYLAAFYDRSFGLHPCMVPMLS